MRLPEILNISVPVRPIELEFHDAVEMLDDAVKLLAFDVGTGIVANQALLGSVDVCPRQT
jgi:hypothetical protein